MLYFIFSVFFAFSFSDAKTFKTKSDDLNVDNRCETYKPSFFTQDRIYYFIVGTKGTSGSKGFDEEVRISRSEATLLWKTLNPKLSKKEQFAALSKVKRSSRLYKYYELLVKAQIERGATYYSEGEILEILSYTSLFEAESFIEKLKVFFDVSSLPVSDLFITGGVTYHDKKGRTLGELDIVIGDHDTCQILAIGEAKLGGKVGKAKRQLQRLRNFIYRL